MSIGARLKELRLERGLTQAELAKILHLTPKAISFYELDQRVPTKDVMDAILKYFSISYEQLTGLSEDEDMDIHHAMSELIKKIEHDALSFDGEKMDMDLETRELLINSLENSHRLARMIARRKYTPKKYRGDDDK
ncbi:MAG: helix-turn-helix transcriptional regulator [Tissierellia bacterium]|nr:helix-turn-helix transcriptional regulator [Tissierellia bacterium]